MSLFKWIHRIRTRRKNSDPNQKVKVDSQGVTRTLPNGKIEQTTWEKLIAVDIMTTSDGPFAEDVFFVLSAEDRTGCVVPQCLADDLIPRLFKLPEMDFEAVISAMACTDDKTFPCWRRPDGLSGEMVRERVNLE